MDYATGAVSRDVRLVLDSHLGVCPTCRQIVAETEEIGGALLDALPPAEMGADALALALARIERPAPQSPEPPQPNDWITVPSEVLEAAQKRRRWVAPGVWVASISKGPGRARSYLLGVGAGMSMPRHTHRGFEMTCILKGAYRDGDLLIGPGDFHCCNETVEHQPAITADGECVCVVAAQDTLVPRDWIGRLFQPFVGI
jgi:putative transcriptional regulator